VLFSLQAKGTNHIANFKIIFSEIEFFREDRLDYILLNFNNFHPSVKPAFIIRFLLLKKVSMPNNLQSLDILLGAHLCSTKSSFCIF